MRASSVRFSVALLFGAAVAPCYASKPSVGLDVNIVVSPANPKPGQEFEATMHYVVSKELGTITSLRIATRSARTSAGEVCATVVSGGEGPRLANVKPGQYEAVARFKLLSNAERCTVSFEALTREDPKTLSKDGSVYGYTLFDDK